MGYGVSDSGYRGRGNRYKGKSAKEMERVFKENTGIDLFGMVNLNNQYIAENLVDQINGLLDDVPALKTVLQDVSIKTFKDYGSGAMTSYAKTDIRIRAEGRSASLVVQSGQLNKPDFVANANRAKDSGFSVRSQDTPERVIVSHELGHVFRETVEGQQLVRVPGVIVSGYSGTSVVENFAETFAGVVGRDTVSLSSPLGRAISQSTGLP